MDLAPDPNHQNKIEISNQHPDDLSELDEPTLKRIKPEMESLDSPSRGKKLNNIDGFRILTSSSTPIIDSPLMVSDYFPPKN